MDQTESNSTNHSLIDWSSVMDRLKFKQRTCTRFIPREIDKECCVCNNTHLASEIVQSNEIWDWKKHTKQEETKCYGLLSPSNRPYLRCDIETEMDDLCYMLFGAWHIPVPSLLMQMIGDIDSTPNIKIQNELLEGISDAAVASDAWIITSGYREESISELIGEAVYHMRMKNPEINFSAIAVGKWGNIIDCHKFQQRNTGNQSANGRFKLETNHTHYIFFDDGTSNSLDNGLFASKLARQISRGAKRKIPRITILVGGTLHALLSIHDNLAKQIPLVVVNGSGSFADILCKYLKLKENNSNSSKNSAKITTDEEEASTADDENNVDIPMLDESFDQDGTHIAIADEKSTEDDEDENASFAYSVKTTLREVLQPLGKNRAEFVSDVRKLYKTIRKEEYNSQGKRLPVGELFTFDEEKAFGEYLYRFANCLKDPFRNWIHVFNTNSSKSLKETIYSAFLQARNNLSKDKINSDKNVNEEMHLALRWSIGQTSENQSISNANLTNHTANMEYNRTLLIDALSKNLLVFVIDFVKLDIDFADLFDYHHYSSIKPVTHWSHKRFYLKELYSHSKRKYKDPLYLLDQIRPKINFTEEKHLNMILKKLVGDIIHPLYENQSKVGSTLVKLREKQDDQIIEAEYIYRDLFLWCILTYRLDMAKIFLSQMKTRICSSIFASKILKSFSFYAPDQASKDTLLNKADEFENYAIEFIRCSYWYDKHQSCELIMRRVDLYGDVTCLQMAVTADNKKFLHEDACQALLTNIWYDKLDPVREQNRLLIGIITFGISQIFISIYQKQFSSSSSVKENNDYGAIRGERRLKKNGIDYTDDYQSSETILSNFLHFHNRPIVKYSYTCLGYVFFLYLFSYYMLFAFDPPKKTFPAIHWMEIVTIITVTTMLFEEIRQFLDEEDRSWKGKILAYFDLDNRISNLFLIVPSYLLFYIGLILRFTQTTSETFPIARIVMGIDLELWFIRSILFIGIAPDLGPKLVMIRHMTNDLLLFIIIIFIFIFGYGITSRAIIGVDLTDSSGGKFLRDVIYPVYYFVLGSFDSEREKLNATQNSNTAFATQIVFALHMLFVNILLLNLLVALFSFKINDVQTQAHCVWAYDRCGIVRVYHGRPALFPPFTFIILIIRFVQYLWNRFVKKRFLKKGNCEPQCFKMIPMNDGIDYAWQEFERYSTNNYIRQLINGILIVIHKGISNDMISESSSNVDEQSRKIKSLVNQLKDNVEDSQEEMTTKIESIESNLTDLQTKLNQIENRFDLWTNDYKEIKKSLDLILMNTNQSRNNELEPPVVENSSRKSSFNQLEQNQPKPSRPIDKSNVQPSKTDKS